MKISLKGFSNKDLAKLFDRAAKADDRHLAKLFDRAAKADDRHLAQAIVYRLAYRHHESFEAQLRYLGKRAVKKENYPSFNMVAKLWKDRD